MSEKIIGRSSPGFTLIELLIVIAIIGLLLTAAVFGLNTARKKSRDAARMANMDQVRKALELYLNENGQYPESDGDGPSGWETPDDGDFIQPLIDGGFLSGKISDPNLPNNFLYYRYPPGYMNCNAAKGGFYVLAIVNLESITGRSPEHQGWECPDKNWDDIGEWVVGAYEL